MIKFIESITDCDLNNGKNYPYVISCLKTSYLCSIISDIIVWWYVFPKSFRDFTEVVEDVFIYITLKIIRFIGIY